MIPLKQKYLHDPEKKQYGDCWRTAIASILECDVELFPVWEYGEEWTDYFPKVLNILESMGYQWGQYTIENTDVRCLDKYSIDGYVIAVNRGVGMAYSKTKVL